MSRFNWREHDKRSLHERFPSEADGYRIRGIGAWRRLVETVFGLAERYPSGERGYLRDLEMDPWDEAFDEFLRDAEQEREVERQREREPEPPGTDCCIFVSHRQIDVNPAERIAYLAARRGFDYWLDVHDPTLQTAIARPLPSPAQEILIAAVIEMGLLNSTHVIAVHTRNSAASKWIPYELGRAKQRRVFSSRACGWFDPSGPQPVAGEYTWLAERTASENDLKDWLTWQSRRCRAAGNGWPYDYEPPPLPR